MDKVVAIEGDVTIPVIGLDEEDRIRLIDEVNIIYHVAANINFSAPLDKAVFVNIEGTKRILQIAKQMKNLQVGIICD